MSEKKPTWWNVYNDITFARDGFGETAPNSLYVQFLINRGLSYFPDSILAANVLNKLTARGIPRFAHYQYAVNTLRPKRRMSKWAKKKAADRDDVVSFVSSEKSMNWMRARDLVLTLTDDQVEDLRKQIAVLDQERGGMTSSRK